jgi:predicted nucleotidyltransferase
MDTTFDLFEWEQTVLTPKVIEPKVIAPREETDLAELPEEDVLKKEAMKDVRDALDESWVDLAYLIDWYKDAVESATMETYSWTLLKDHKTSVSALRQLTDLWKAAHWMNKKEAQEIVFKPLFNKPPKLN